MVTDLAEVLRLAEEKAAENLAFRRYLADRHESAAPFQILAREIQQQTDCQACANCCKHSIVAVTAEEITEIATHLKTTVDEVQRLYLAPDPDQPSERTLKTSAEGCVFLHDNLCLIYEGRPTPCREFPHVGVGSHTLGGRRASQGRWTALCPILFNAIEAYKQLLGFPKKAA